MPRPTEESQPARIRHNAVAQAFLVRLLVHATLRFGSRHRALGCWSRGECFVSLKVVNFGILFVTNMNDNRLVVAIILASIKRVLRRKLSGTSNALPIRDRNSMGSRVSVGVSFYRRYSLGSQQENPDLIEHSPYWQMSSISSSGRRIGLSSRCCRAGGQISVCASL